jgi:hypothetical protein
MTASAKSARLQSISPALTDSFAANYLRRLSAPVLLLGWCVLAIVVFTHDIGWRELWLDELITLQATQLPPIELIGSRYGQGHSGLYFLIVKAWLYVTGAPVTPWAAESYLRVPSAFFAMAAGALLLHALLRLEQVKAAVVLGILWLCWPMLLYYAGEARPYSLVLFFTALAIWGTVRVLHEAERGGEDAAPRKMLIYASGVGGIAAALSMPLGIVAALAVELGALFAFGFRQVPDYWRKRCKVVWSGLAISSIVFLPVVLRKSANYWTDRQPQYSFSVDNIAGVLNAIYAPGGGILYLFPIAVLAAYALAFKRKRLAQQMDHRIWLFLIFGSLFIPAFLIIISAKTSVLVGRYFTPTLCFTLPALALAIAHLHTWTGRLLSMGVVMSVAAAAAQAQTKEPRMLFELKTILESHHISRPVFYATQVRFPPVLTFYFGHLNPEIHFRDKKPAGWELLWVIQTKEEFVTSPGASWIDKDRQCSFRFTNGVITLAAANAQQLRSFENCQPVASSAGHAWLSRSSGAHYPNSPCITPQPQAWFCAAAISSRGAGHRGYPGKRLGSPHQRSRRPRLPSYTSRA